MKKKKLVFRNMQEVQKHFFPSKVDKECPYCGKPYKKQEIIVIMPR